MSRRVVSEAGKKLLKHSIKSTNSANKVSVRFGKMCV